MPLNTPFPLSLWLAPRRKVERPTLPNPFFAKNSSLDRGSITISTSSRVLDQFSHILITMSASNWVLWNRILLTWFRFEGSAGIRMTLSCQPTMRCGTHITNWINGGHPSVADGQVSRTVCFHWTAGCCEFLTNIKVRLKCGSYYVFYLNGIPTCYGRYKRVLHVNFSFTQSGFLSFLY